MKRPRLVCTILILYFIEPYAHVSCTKSDDGDKLASIPLEQEFSNSDGTVRSQRGLTKLDVTDNEDRTSRSVPESRKHLRVGDAHQVANYFLTGGPLKGHSHFFGSANCDSKNEGNDVVGSSNPVNEDGTDLFENNKITDNAEANIPDSLVGLPYIPAVHHLVRRPHIRRPSHGIVNFPPSPLVGGYHNIPVTGSLLRSILHPRFHPYINRLHTIPRALVRAAIMPMHGLLHAHTQLNNALLPGLSQPGEGSLLGSAVPIDESNVNVGSDLLNSNGGDAPALGSYPTYPTGFNGNTPLTHLVHSDYFPHLQPTGYIVKFVPHGRSSLSPVVGSPQESSDDSDSNTEENIGSVHTEDEDIGMAEQDDVVDENEDC